MTSPASLSVIVPNYNYAHYLEERLNSIQQATDLDQTHLIFLDDKSTDDSLDIFQAWCKKNDRQAITIPNQTNSQNPLGQWQKGIQNATSDYVWIAESDDTCHPSIIKKLTEKLDADPSIGIAFTFSKLIDQDGNPLSVPPRWQQIWGDKQWKQDFVMDGREFAENHMLIHNMIPNASAVVLRKQLWDAIPLDIEKRLRLNGDWLRWLQLLPHTKVAYIAEPLNYFRWHNQSQREQTRTNFDDIHELYYVMQKGMTWNDVPRWRREKTWTFLLLSFLYRLFRRDDLTLLTRFSGANHEAIKAAKIDRFARLRLYTLFLPYALWESVKKIMRNR